MSDNEEGVEEIGEQEGQLETSGGNWKWIIGVIVTILILGVIGFLVYWFVYRKPSPKLENTLEVFVDENSKIITSTSEPVSSENGVPLTYGPQYRVDSYKYIITDDDSKYVQGTFAGKNYEYLHVVAIRSFTNDGVQSNSVDTSGYIVDLKGDYVLSTVGQRIRLGVNGITKGTDDYIMRDGQKVLDYNLDPIKVSVQDFTYETPFRFDPEGNVFDARSQIVHDSDGNIINFKGTSYKLSSRTMIYTQGNDLVLDTNNSNTPIDLNSTFYKINDPMHNKLLYNGGSNNGKPVLDKDGTAIDLNSVKYSFSTQWVLNADGTRAKTADDQEMELKAYNVIQDVLLDTSPMEGQKAIVVITNTQPHDIWVNFIGGTGTIPGVVRYFKLPAHSSRALDIPESAREELISMKIWRNHQCDSKGHCQVGFQVPVPGYPTPDGGYTLGLDTSVEFTYDQKNSTLTYDVSFVDGITGDIAVFAKDSSGNLVEKDVHGLDASIIVTNVLDNLSTLEDQSLDLGTVQIPYAYRRGGKNMGILSPCTTTENFQNNLYPGTSLVTATYPPLTGAIPENDKHNRWWYCCPVQINANDPPYTQAPEMCKLDADGQGHTGNSLIETTAYVQEIKKFYKDLYTYSFDDVAGTRTVPYSTNLEIKF